MHKTKDWSAVEKTNFAGGDRKLVVSGQVESLDTNEKFTLTESAPQGINPAILILDLAFTKTGIGGHVVQWVPIAFETPVSHHQYGEVSIKGETEMVSFKVTVLTS